MFVAICNDVLSLKGNYINYMQLHIEPSGGGKKKRRDPFPFLELGVALGQI